MASYDYGKDEIVSYIYQNFAPSSTCLDVGACDGKWQWMLGHYLTMDAVEIFEPNVVKHRLREKYRRTWICDIDDFKYNYYDLIIFGDVIEHMEVEKAQRVLEYAKTRCRDMIIGVPFLYKQGALYGNIYERHIQDDLTAEVFKERYSGLEVLIQPTSDYCYYHKAPHSDKK